MALRISIGGFKRRCSRREARLRVLQVFLLVVIPVWLIVVQGERPERRYCKSIPSLKHSSCIGLSPNSRLFKDIANADAQGFIMTGIDFQTSTEGIFAAGTVRAVRTKQLVSTAG